MSETALILNPHAGKGKAGRLFPMVEKRLKDQGLIFDVFETAGPGHATELCRSAIERGARTIIAAGGDGTIREAASALVGDTIPEQGDSPGRALREGSLPVPGHVPHDAALGIIPLGSGNDYIKSAGIPRDLDDACIVVARGKTRLVDLIRVGATWSANAIGVGFDALVVVEANRMRWLRGLPLYLAAVLKATMHFDCPRTTIELDDQRWEQTILLIACANGHHFGGGFHIAPEAQIDDGLLDICVIDAVRGLTILQKLMYVIKGTHAQLKEVKFYRARKVRLTSPDILYVQADGDLLPEVDPHCLEIEVRPRALRIIVP